MFDWLRKKLAKQEEDHLLKQYGGTQKCPWCRNWMQSSSETECHDDDHFATMFTCGHCKGKSLWRWEMFMIFVGPYSPPEPDFSDNKLMSFVGFNAFDPTQWTQKQPMEPPNEAPKGGDA